MKKIFMISAGAIVGIAFFAFAFVEFFGEPPALRTPAAAPESYESKTAQEKQDILWKAITDSTHANLSKAPYRSFGLSQLMGLGLQHILPKGQLQSDYAPKGWKKYLHGRGSIAKVKVVPVNREYTGIFQGADHALLRLSLTYKPKDGMIKDMPVAPGLAFKVLRDKTPSANVSALVSLNGQGFDYNFFSHAMSNIVPIGTDWGQERVHNIFKKVAKYPEELGLDHLGAIDSHGQKVESAHAPRQIFFVPGERIAALNFSADEHDVREDFAKIPVNTVVYKIFAVSDKHKGFKYAADYKEETVAQMQNDSVHIADIVTTSEFVASAFGDDGIFFRHELK